MHKLFFEPYILKEIDFKSLTLTFFNLIILFNYFESSDLGIK